MVEEVQIPSPFSGGPEGRVLRATGTENTRSPALMNVGPPLNGIRAKLAALAVDIKLQHSIFALPWAILATVLAASRGDGLKISQLILICICMVSARTVAMVANRLLDAEFDKHNPRTARRAVPAGRISKPFAWAALAASAIIFIAGTSGFLIYHNFWPIAFAVPLLAFLVGYSLMKRYTRLCHYYLGTALALAPVCAWLAITGRINLPPIWMFATVMLWTAGFDILYACQDYRFDVANGLFSVPAKIGIGPALWVSRLTHLASVGFLILLGTTTPELGIYFYIGITLAVMLLVIEHSLVKPNDLSKLNLAFFTLNGVISLVLGTLGIVDVMVRK